jgi:hypothetical protein
MSDDYQAVPADSAAEAAFDIEAPVENDGPAPPLRRQRSSFREYRSIYRDAEMA